MRAGDYGEHHGAERKDHESGRRAAFQVQRASVLMRLHEAGSCFGFKTHLALEGPPEVASAFVPFGTHAAA